MAICISLSDSRTGFKFNTELQPGLDDLVAVTFATDFGDISDIKTGPDGYLYVLSIKDGSRILPVTAP